MPKKKSIRRKQNRERQTLVNPRTNGIFIRLSTEEKENIQTHAKRDVIARGNVSLFIRTKLGAALYE